MFRNKNNGKSMKQELMEIKKRLEKAVNYDIPRAMMNNLEDIVDNSFAKEQYDGNNTSGKWAGRKKDSEGSKKRSERKALLVDSANLKRSITVDVGIAEVKVGTDVKYAQIHNEGLQGKAFGKHSFKMPKRQFMPIPGERIEKLDRDMEKEIDKIVTNILN